MFKYGIITLTFLIFLAGCAGTGDKTPSVKDRKIVPPVLQIKPEFIYPKEAQEKGIEGIVDIYVYVNKNGEVRESKIANSSNYDQLDEAAKVYVSQMKFKPAQKNGQAIGVWLKYEIYYTFADDREKFEIQVYVSNLSQYLNEAASENSVERDDAIQMIMELHQGYADYIRKYPTKNYNQTIAKQLTPTTINKWGKFFDFWPLTFVVYDDLNFRFPESNYITLIRKQMMDLMYEDLIRAEKIDQRETVLMKKSVDFAKELRLYLSQNHQGQIPELLNLELERLITLY